jgi:hypothetical protein
MFFIKIIKKHCETFCYLLNYILKRVSQHFLTVLIKMLHNLEV